MKILYNIWNISLQVYYKKFAANIKHFQKFSVYMKNFNSNSADAWTFLLNFAIQLRMNMMQVCMVIIVLNCNGLVKSSFDGGRESSSVWRGQKMEREQNLCFSEMENMTRICYPLLVMC